ncbi:apolipoprotein N-acyltransferase [bacterium]|nr:apolipoprotein N-acyltransferase [bacterium]MBU1921418.1 apolipoprotein N-acyltransferase [bacterium]
MITRFLEKRGLWLSALLGILAFPPIGLWPLAYIAMVPFLFTATAASTRHPFWTAYGAGLVFFWGIIYWIGFNSGAPWYFAWPSVIAMTLILGTVWGFASWLTAAVNRRHGPLFASLTFVSFYLLEEIFWGTGEFSFPWANWALTQTTFLPAIQIADLGDWYGVSFWVLLINGLVFLQLRRMDPIRSWRWITAVVFVLPMIYGLVRMAQVDESGHRLNVAAVQANTPAEIKWQMNAEEILQDHVDISHELLGEQISLLVWPETAAPTPLRYRNWARTALNELSDTLNAVIVTGATDYKSAAVEDRVPYNAAFVVQPYTAELQSTAKVQLVPFGERIPWQKTFPFLGNIRLGQAEFMPAEHPTVFENTGIPPFACLICFEVCFPYVAAYMVNHGAQILAHITNDGWYGDTSGPYQHLYLSRLRAVATRRSIVRAANTGISALILPSGRFQSTLGYDQAGYLKGSLPLRSDRTLAVRLESFWYPFYLCLLLGLLVMLRFRRAGKAGGERR